MVQVKKRENESSESLIRRFTKKIQQSGLIIRAKKGQHFAKPLTKDKLRENAVRRSKTREKIEYLKKIGKFEETQTRGKSDFKRK